LRGSPRDEPAVPRAFSIPGMTTLLRGPTLWVTERPAVRWLITKHRLGRAFALRFVAGDNLEAGMAAARRLAGRGIASMLDHLGENVETAEAAAEATDTYVRALKRIREHPDLDVDISVKLTQLGLDLSRELCTDNLERVVQAAGGGLVMIDMEASAYVQGTLDIYRAVRERHPNVGICLQACLHRTMGDGHRIGGPGAVIRVVKGAYLEPPEVAMQRRREVDRAFARLAATLLASGTTVHLATHDPSLIEGAKGFIRARAIPRSRYEFQMLYGIRTDLQAGLVADGEPVRVYLPYGTSWYPYLTRRLAERPANAWFFLSNAVRGSRRT